MRLSGMSGSCLLVTATAKSRARPEAPVAGVTGDELDEGMRPVIDAPKIQKEVQADHVMGRKVVDGRR